MSRKNNHKKNLIKRQKQCKIDKTNYIKEIPEMVMKKFLPLTNFEPKELTPMTYFAKNFVNIKKPDGNTIKLSEKQIEEIKWYEKMSKTHIPELIKLRRGTNIVWRKKE